jgi:putative nucleotidyltransferase with HDIG domain
MGKLSVRKENDSFSHKDLWFHSVAVSTALKELSKRSGKQEDYDYLFIVGLLHDIGMIVYDQFFEDLFKSVLDEADNNEGLELCIAERNTIGADHGEVGGILLKRWKFPDSISHPIEMHHHNIEIEGEGAQDIALLRIADALSHELDMKRGNNRVPPVLQMEDIQTAGINQEELEDIKAYLNEEEESINAFFNAMF